MRSLSPSTQTQRLKKFINRGSDEMAEETIDMSTY